MEELALPFTNTTAEKRETLRLRPYQQECLEAIHDAYACGVKRGIVILPPSTGKCILLARVPQWLNIKSMLVLASSRELVEQAAAECTRANPSLTVGIEQADRSAPLSSDIVVATVQTLGTKSGGRRKRFHDDRFDVIVTDECHHDPTNTRRRILRHYGVGTTTQAPFYLGFTATPYRGDGIKLSGVFDEIIYHKSMTELIDLGISADDGPYLAPMRGIRVYSETDLSQLHANADFADEEIAQAVNVDARNSLIISAIEDHAADRNCILVFAASVAHCDALAKQLRDRGHDAQALSEKTPSAERYRILNDFWNGRLRIVVNVFVLAEGYNNPRIDAIVMTRPTKSPLRYVQSVSRGGRPFPGKKDCLVIDVADTCGEHDIQDLPKMFGFRDIDLLGSDVMLAKQRLKKAEGLAVRISNGDTVDQVEKRAELIEGLARGTIYLHTRAEAVEVFKAASIEPSIAEFSAFPWLKTAVDRYAMRPFDGKTIELWRNPLGDWFCLHDSIRYRLDGSTSGVPWKWADKLVKRLYPADHSKMRMDAWWQTQPATEKQLNYLKRAFHIAAGALPPNLTKGAVRQVLDYLTWARQQTRRRT